MTEDHWCAVCWLTKRTVFHDEFEKYLCEPCFQQLMTRELEKLGMRK